MAPELLAFAHASHPSEDSLFGGLARPIKKLIDGIAWGFGTAFGRHLFLVMGLGLAIAVVVLILFGPKILAAFRRLAAKSKTRS